MTMNTITIDNEFDASIIDILIKCHDFYYTATHLWRHIEWIGGRRELRERRRGQLLVFIYKHFIYIIRHTIILTYKQQVDVINLKTKQLQVKLLG